MLRGLSLLISMPNNVYYFHPFAAELGIQRLSGGYRVVAISRAARQLPDWELPAILIFDGAEDDLASLENLHRNRTLGE